MKCSVLENGETSEFLFSFYVSRGKRKRPNTRRYKNAGKIESGRRLLHVPWKQIENFQETLQRFNCLIALALRFVGARIVRAFILFIYLFIIYRRPVGSVGRAPDYRVASSNPDRTNTQGL